MLISILSPNLSNNSLGRAYMLAKILQRRYKVEIIGPVFGENIWKPVAELGDVDYKFVKLKGRFESYWQLNELLDKISGNVILATKPLFTSYGIGLISKIRQNRPIILDIDDWEFGFLKEMSHSISSFKFFAYLISSIIFIYNPYSYWNINIFEHLYFLADDILVSNNFLKNKFGGTLIRHGRDSETFNPINFEKNIIRDKYGIARNKKVIMFFGSIRPHKGLDDLINAVNFIDNEDILLVVVGIDTNNDGRKLVNFANILLGKKFHGLGLQSFEKVPEILSMADIIVIPQKENLASIGQVPAKVFDAMAMAKPIVGTDVSDIRDILEGCGIIVSPDNPKELSTAIEYFIQHPTYASEMGENARNRFCKKYSWDSIEKKLLTVISKYEKH